MDMANTFADSVV